MSTQYEKTSKIDEIHIHKHTEYSLQLTELIRRWKVKKFIQKKKARFLVKTAIKMSLH